MGSALTGVKEGAYCEQILNLSIFESAGAESRLRVRKRRRPHIAALHLMHLSAC